MWLTDPQDPNVARVLLWTCDLCKAQKGKLCVNTISPGQPIPGRIVHLARTVDRRRE